MWSGDMADAGMDCMGIDDMTGLIRPAEEEEAVGLGWEGVGAAGAENRKSSFPVEEGSVPVRITRRKNKKEKEREDKEKLTAQRRHNWVHLTLKRKVDTGLFPLILALMSSGVSVNGPCVYLGDKAKPIIRHVVGNAGTGGIYALWNALVQWDPPKGLGSAANKTREVRVSAAKEARDTRSVEESCRLPQTHSRAKLRHVARRPLPAAFPASSPSATCWLKDRMAQREKRRVAAPNPRNGDRVSDGEYALVDCLAPVFLCPLRAAC